jgi:hypothetical protein
VSSWNGRFGGSVFRRPADSCYVECMTKLLEEAIAKVRQLPEDEQNAAAGALLDYLNSMQDLQLTDEQLAEVRRRRAMKEPVTLTLDELDERLRRRGA